MAAILHPDKAKLTFCSFCGTSNQMDYIYCNENAGICEECLTIINGIKKMRAKDVVKFMGRIPKEP